MNLQEQLSMIKSLITRTNSAKQILKSSNFPIKNLRRPNGVIGTQGFTSESLINLINHISKTEKITLPKYSTLTELITSLKKNPESVNKIVNYLKKDPIVVLELPDLSYQIKDGNHRANLLNLLGVENIPTIIVK
jgi:hypothetical protein